MAEFPIPLDAFAVHDFGFQTGAEIDARGFVLRTHTPYEGLDPSWAADWRAALTFTGDYGDWPIDEESGDPVPWFPSYVELEVQITGSWDSQCAVAGGSIWSRVYWATSEYEQLGDATVFVATVDGSPDNEIGWVSPFSNGGTVTVSSDTGAYSGYPPIVIFRLTVTPYLELIGTSSFEIRVLSASSDVKHPLAVDDEEDLASGRLLKETHKTYIAGRPGSPGAPAVPATPGYWKKELVPETWYMEQEVFRRTEKLVFFPEPPPGEWRWIEIIYNDFIYTPFTKLVEKMVWYPPNPGSPAIPAIPPVLTQTITDLQLGWNAKAEGVRTQDGDVRFEFKSNTANYGAVIGLTDPASAPVVTYTTIRYGWYLATNTAQPIESGTKVATVATFQPGALFAIVRAGRKVTYLIDGKAHYVSALASDEPTLQPDAAMYAGGDEIYSYRMVSGSVVALAGQLRGRLIPLRSGLCSSLGGTARSTAQKLQPLTGRGGIVAIGGGFTRDQRFKALGGIGLEQPAVFARGAFRALQSRSWPGAHAGPGSRFAPLTGMAWTAGGSVMGKGRLLALTGYGGSRMGQSGGDRSFAALLGSAFEDSVAWARGTLAALGGTGGDFDNGQTSRGVGRLRALKGRAYATGGQAWSNHQAFGALRSHVDAGDAGGGTLPALTGIGFEEASTFARGRLAALTSHVGVGADAGGRSALPALKGVAFAATSAFARGKFSALGGSAAGPGATSSGDRSLAALRSFASEDVVSYARGVLPALDGAAVGPGAPGGGDRALAALRGHAYAGAPPVFAGGQLRALTGYGFTYKGLNVGDSRMPALWGIGSDRAGFAWARGSLKALTSSGEGGFIVPPRPVDGRGWLPSLVSWGHGYTVGVGSGDGSLVPLSGFGSDHGIAVQQDARLAPLGHLWSGQYDPPTMCVRYIPRLLASAEATVSPPAQASLPVPIGADIIEVRAQTCPLNAVVATHRLAVALLGAYPAAGGNLRARVGGVVSKQKLRTYRINARIE
jgi:hypothetical protein